MENEQLLALALALSFLGYNLGALLTMLPLPFQGVKKWGYVIMKDSVYAAVLSMSSGIIVYVVTYVQNILGSDWSAFDSWIVERTGFLIGWKTAFSAFMAATSKFTGGSFVHTVFEPVTKMINYALTTLYSILSVSLIIRSFYLKMIFLGILLLSVPFRLTRSVGAYFIAFSIVFLIGLPFMPLFISEFSYSQSLPSPPSDTVEFVFFDVKTALGEPIPYGVLEGFSSNRLIFRYLSDENGVINAGFPDKGVPMNTTYNVDLVYLGIKTMLVPSHIDPQVHYTFSNKLLPEARAYVNLTAPLLITTLGSSVGVFRSHNLEVVIVSYGSNEVTLKARPVDGDGFLIIRYSMGCNVVISGQANQTLLKDWSWGGLRGKEARIPISNKNDTMVEITVRSAGCTEANKPRIKEVTYLDSIGLSPWKDFSRFAASILLSWVVMPAIFVFILGVISAALAYLIGGSKDKVPFKLW